jgi:hypothetical protein
MTKIWIDFLLKFDSEQGLAYSGPIFFQWEPTESDVIILKISEQDAILKLWFEGVSKYDEFADGMTKASKIRGRLEIDNLDQEIEKIFETNKTVYRPYEEFGKRVIKKLIEPSINRLLKIITINYGQYWIPEFIKWDSRDTTLGQYCSGLNMRWSLDCKTWLDFRPEIRVRSSLKFRVAGDSFFHQFMERKDWTLLEEFIAKNYEPSSAVMLLGRAYKYLEQKDIRSSFMEGISSLELSIEEFLRFKIESNQLDKSMEDSLVEFLQKGLRAQVVSLGISIDSIPMSDIELAIKAIEMRNSIVHQGLIPSLDHSKPILMGLFRTISHFVTGPPLKFPQKAL